MRIALVCGHGAAARLPSTDSGMHRARVQGLADALAALGDQVTVHRPGRPDRSGSGGDRQAGELRAGSGPADGLAAALEFGGRLGREWDRTRPDVVHSLCPPAVLPAATGLGAGRSPLLQTVELVGLPGQRLDDRSERRAPQPADRSAAGQPLPATGGWLAQGVVDAFLPTHSQALRDLTRAGVDPAAARIVPWGVDPDRFTPHRAGPGSGGPAVLLSTAGLHELDGADLLVRALPEIPGARLVLGGGPHRSRLDGDLDARRVLALARERGVADRVLLLGALTEPELPALLAAADLVVWAGWRQPTGVLPVEPMAAGVPVLATAVGGALDAIAHRLTGVLVAPGRPEALAVAARRLLADPAQRSRYARAAVASVRSRHTWEQTALIARASYRAALTGVGRTVRRPDLADPVGPGLSS